MSPAKLLSAQPSEGRVIAANGAGGSPRLMNRKDVATRLSRTREGVRYLEEKGEIAPRARREDGSVWYDPDDVERLAHKLALPTKGTLKDPGELAARAVELHRRGATVADAVRELRQPFDVVRALYREVASPDAIVIEGELLERLALAELGGVSALDLVEQLEQLRELERRLLELREENTALRAELERRPPAASSSSPAARAGTPRRSRS